MEPVTNATSEGVTEPTTDPTSAGEVTTSTAPSSEGSTASAAAPSEDGVNIDWASVPQELRPHVEKFTKKHEQDFKRAYTQKFQALSAKEKVWEQERAGFTQEREQWKAIATDVLKNPAKLDTYRQMFNVPAGPSVAEGSLPESVTTVGEFLAWQKQQHAQLRETLLNEAATKVQTITATNRWASALAAKEKDRHFAKYKDFIVQLAQTDPEVRARWTGTNEEDVLQAAQDKFKVMLREDMEEVKERTLAEQQRKKADTTAVPASTVPVAQAAATSKEEVIARIRSRLGPPAASM